MSFFNIKIISLLLVVCTAYLVNAETVGRTEASGTTSQMLSRSAQRITMPEGGTITSISFYHGATGAQVVVGIYNDNGDNPGTLLERSGIMGVENAGWQTIPLSNPVPASAGQTLWLAWMFQSGPSTKFINDGSVNGYRHVNGSTWTYDPNTILPSSFGTSAGWLQERIYSVYATYTPSGSGTGPWVYDPDQGTVCTSSKAIVGDCAGGATSTVIEDARIELNGNLSENALLTDDYLQFSRVTGEQTSVGPSSISVDNGLSQTLITSSSIRTGTVYVGTSGWSITAPDYVFKKDYELMPLKEVEKFVTTHKHLPDIPSAKSMEENGSVDLVGMNLKLLKKIEELTLHSIEQEKRIIALEKSAEVK